MLGNARELLSEMKVGRRRNEIHEANVPINEPKNVRIFGQRAADTEGYVFGIELELFIHHHHEINQILGRHEAIAVGEYQIFTVEKEDLNLIVTDIGEQLMPTFLLRYFLIALN